MSGSWRNVCQRLSLLSQTGVVTAQDVEELIAESRWELRQAGTEVRQQLQMSPAGDTLTPEERRLYELVRPSRPRRSWQKNWRQPEHTLEKNQRDKNETKLRHCRYFLEPNNCGPPTAGQQPCQIAHRGRWVIPDKIALHFCALLTENLHDFGKYYENET